MADVDERLHDQYVGPVSGHAQAVSEEPAQARELCRILGSGVAVSLSLRSSVLHATALGTLQRSHY